MNGMLNQPATDLQLWERFQTGRCSDEEIERSIVLRRWARCRDAGLSADNPGEPVIALATLAEAIHSFSPLLAPGAPFDAFASTIAKAGCCGIFSDANGLVIARRIAEPFASKVSKSRLVEGAVWSEGARGTNGIGTALVEQAPVSIVGAEHYELRNHVLACYAAPIRDVRERVVAVLDATGPVSSGAGFIHASVVATAAAIEALIVARTYDAALPGGLFELERLLARLPHASLVLEATGHVRRANIRFHTLLPGVPPAQLAELVRSSLARRPRGATATLETLPGPLRGMVLEFEPIGQSDDPFAAIVHLKPRRERYHSLGPGDPVPEVFMPIVGSDPAIVAARGRAARFARTDLPILLIAETGAGKEIFARCIHAGSAHARAPFVAVNCGALAGTLLES